MTSQRETYSWLNEDSRLFLERGYLTKGQTPENRIKEIGRAAEKILNIDGYAKRFEKCMAQGWFSLASPIWANFGLERGLPVSCFGSYVDDTMESILGKTAEVGMMTKMGGGTSAYFGDLRERGADIKSGGKSNGPVHFMELFETVTNVVSQANVRRGSFAAYLPIDHADIMEFLQIRDDGAAIQNISLGVTIPDRWMKEMIGGDKGKRKVWGRVLQKRFESGYPYLFFSDTVNRGAPDVYKEKGMKIHASNLCTEIALSSSQSESFVCNISSMNLLHYDEWKDTDAVEVMVLLLDAALTEFIEKTKNLLYMETARAFAISQRALGIGTLGWHSYLQSRSIPFESLEAKMINTAIHSNLSKQAHMASRKLAALFGEPELLKGTGRRHVTLLAIAPTTSSSFILGQVSPSVEPLNSNYFVKDLAKGKFTYRNPYLMKVLDAHDKNTREVWSSILTHGGSVQHLKFLTDVEKAIFKTFGEISQKEIIIQAIGRQKYIDQAQSINLMIHPKTPVKDVNELLIFAWEQGVKTLYYQRGTNPSQELTRNLLHCASCEA